MRHVLTAGAAFVAGVGFTTTIATGLRPEAKVLASRGSPFETLNALSKRLENRKRSRRAHVLVQLIGEMICSLFVLFMLRSQLESESRRDERLIKAGAAWHVLCAKQE